MALALTAALAWYAFVKGGINKVWPEHGDKIWALGAFAVIVTVIFVAVLVFIKKILNKNIPARPIYYGVAPGMTSM